MRKIYMLVVASIIACFAANAACLQIAGVVVTESNASDILGDGTIKYDVATNTITLDSLNISLPDDVAFIGVVDNGNGVSINFNSGKELSINLCHKNTVNTGWIMKEGVDVAAVELPFNVRINGSGILNLTSWGTSIKASTFTVEGGCVVNLKNDSPEGAWHETLIADHLYVNRSVLNVVANEFVSTAINRSMKTANFEGVYSGHYLSHKTETYQVRERYKYAYHGGANNTYEYRTRTVNKTRTYDGWYHEDFILSKNIDIYPNTYPIWINDVNVTRYNYTNILGDGSTSYDPLTKTLIKSKPIDIKYEGFLILKDDYNGTITNLEVENGNSEGMVQAENIELPPYVNKIEEASTFGRIIFNYLGSEGYEMFEPTTSGDCSFPAIESGKVTYDAQNGILTFDNAVLNDCQMIIRDGNLNINLVGETSFNSDIQEDLTFYLAKVNISGEGSLTANMIYNVKCDSLIIEGGCSVDIKHTSGDGILKIDNSTLALRGDTNNIGSMFGYYGLSLDNCVIQMPQSISYWSFYTPASENYFGYLTIDGQSPFCGEVRISPIPSSDIELINNNHPFDPTAPKYDLLGRPVDDNYMGIFVQNGRKIKQIK